jgi:hypothetical protein
MVLFLSSLSLSAAFCPCTIETATLPSALPEAEVAYDMGNVPEATAVLVPSEDLEAQAHTATATSYQDNSWGSPTNPAPLLEPSPVAHATAVAEHGTVLQLPGLGMTPKRIVCPICHCQGKTTIRSSVDPCTIIAVVVLFLTFWPIFWLPFLLPGCKTTEHFCSHCHRKVGWIDTLLEWAALDEGMLTAFPFFLCRVGWFGPGLFGRSVRLLLSGIPWTLWKVNVCTDKHG